jgi:carbamoyltransferase
MDKFNYLGLGKTKYFSSVCYIPEGDRNKMQVWQSERLTRKKNSGAWPHLALQSFLGSLKNNPESLIISENRDVETPAFFENFYNETFPFFDFLIKSKLQKFSSEFNRDVNFVTHHEAHAYASLLMSPFEKAVIVVMDGAGSRAKDFSPSPQQVEHDALEECSIYLQDGPRLKNVFKRWIRHEEGKEKKLISNGIGHLYESSSTFIFSDENSSGKVMGLAPFGESIPIADRKEFLNDLDWKLSFNGKDKKEWEASLHQNHFRNLAATVQREFENDYQTIISKIRDEFPEYKNLILAGGCALNCTNNARIYYQKIFDQIYVLPFPGDDGIAVGCAGKELYTRQPEIWEPLKFSEQRSYWGPLESMPDLFNEAELKKMLEKKNIQFEMSSDVVKEATDDLKNGLVIGWCQGRSESGPRALGHRSILARPDKVGIKNLLNEKIKKREAFRPYGCSVPQEKAAVYFDIDPEFENPFMSFAVKTRESFQEILGEVCHIDKTSRMQTIRKTQDELFYNLINAFGDETGLYCLLNTSLNIMGEPIVETLEDAVRFFEATPVDAMYIGRFRLKRK